MKAVDIEQMLTTAKPMPVKPAPMTRQQKLTHWARLLRSLPPDETLWIFHKLEYWSKPTLGVIVRDHTRWQSRSAFCVAFAHPAFREQGLPNESAGRFADIMNFFQLSQEQLHEFSCDCGGQINTRDMADRIDRLAGNPAPTMMARSSNALGQAFRSVFGY